MSGLSTGMMSHDLLRVAVDARPLTTSHAGIAIYCRDLVRGFGSAPEEARLVLYAKESRPDGLELGPSLAWRSLPARMWLPLALPRALQAGRIDLFHGTNHMAPPLSLVPTVVTVHDLSALTMPQFHTWRNRLLTVPQMLLSLYRATRLIAISQFTAREIARLPGLDASRIRVVYRCADPDLKPATPHAIQELRRRMQLPPAFFLYLGALEPRKNVAALVRAFGLLQVGGDDRAALVIAGAEGWRNDDVYHTVRELGLESAVHFAGYVPAQDLPALYGAATAFVFPSLFEGFGLPPLEAMACGTPVISSNAASLPEVVGDAALTFDPHSDAELAAAMHRVLDDEALRLRLREAGFTRVTLFSLERHTRETLQVYRDALAPTQGQRR